MFRMTVMFRGGVINGPSPLHFILKILCFHKMHIVQIHMKSPLVTFSGELGILFVHNKYCISFATCANQGYYH